ncbi:suppressor of cytokine signaling 3-like [Lethenteron reissneri]|uniref:suppressor of cytokine signaling 3-like n=1 Tax=Lethenteron reissneri TaxID=7753 RepID=UPI002AB740D4|nr:suppressor of cytokine signaling 3-like [Lethenteron reissneri]XP_061412875.1 suppressor of cytokine signaling 3-like [Lethenteron reissneri]
MGFICPGRRELDAASAMGVRVVAAGSAAASTESRPFAGEPGTDSRAARLWREPRAWAPHPGPVSPPLPRPPRSSSSSSAVAVTVVDAAPVATRLRSFTSAQELLAVQRTVAALAESGFYWGSVAGPEARRLLASQPVGTFLVRDSTDPRHLFSLTLRTRLGATSVRVQLHAGRFRLECSQRRDALPGFDCVLRLLEHYVRPAGPPGVDFNNGDNNNNADNAAAQSGAGGRGGGASHRHAQRGGPLAVTERGSVAEKRRAQQQQREQQQQQQREEEEAAAAARAAAGVAGKGRTPLLLTRPLRHTRVPQLQHLARKAVHRALAGRKPEQLQLPSLLQGYLETYPYQL